MSTQTQPMYIALFNEIIDELNGLVQQDLDEFTRIKRLHQIEAKAITLGEYDHSLFFSAMGSIACAQGDEEKMRRYHENSFKYNKMPLILRNYSVSLNILDRNEEAFDMALQAYQADESDLDSLSQLVLCAINLRDEEKYLCYAKRYEELAGKPHPSWSEYLEEQEETKGLTEACMALTARTMDALRD